MVSDSILGSRYSRWPHTPGQGTPRELYFGILTRTLVFWYFSQVFWYFASKTRHESGFFRGVGSTSMAPAALDCVTSVGVWPILQEIDFLFIQIGSAGLAWEDISGFDGGGGGGRFVQKTVGSQNTNRRPRSNCRRKTASGGSVPFFLRFHSCW